jgi:hypothetical protein
LGLFGPPDIEKLRSRADINGLVKALRHKQSEIQLRAADALGALGPAAVEPLIAALGDDDYGVRILAAKTLGELHDARAVEPLLASLGDEQNAAGQAVAKALVTFGEPVVEPLIGALGDRNGSVRYYAAMALGELGDDRAVEPLVGLLRDREGSVRWEALLALRDLGEPHIAAMTDVNWTGNLDDAVDRAVVALGIGAPDAEVPAHAVGVRVCATCGSPALTTGEFIAAAKQAGFIVDPMTGEATSALSGAFTGVGELAATRAQQQRRYEEIEARRGYVCQKCGKLHCTACLMRTAQHPVTGGPRCPSCGEGPHAILGH